MTFPKPLKKVTVEGQEFYLRRFTDQELKDARMRLTAKEGEEQALANWDKRKQVVATCLCDEQGQPVCTVESLASVDFAVITALCNEINKYNFEDVGPKVEEAKKN